MVAYVPFIVALVGLLMWLIPQQPKYEKTRAVGQWLFIVGLFWFVGGLAGRTIKLF